MSATDQSPARARAMTSGPTGRVHSLPLSTSRSHAARLCATGSKLPAIAAQHRSPTTPRVPRLRRGVLPDGFQQPVANWPGAGVVELHEVLVDQRSEVSDDLARGHVLICGDRLGGVKDE